MTKSFKHTSAYIYLRPAFTPRGYVLSSFPNVIRITYKLQMLPNTVLLSYALAST